MPTRSTETPPPETPVAEETLDQISRRLVVESGLKLYGKRRQSLEDLIFSAMRERDQRAARIIKEHRESDICKENCWTTITNQILGVSGKESNSDAGI